MAGQARHPRLEPRLVNARAILVALPGGWSGRLWKNTRLYLRFDRTDMGYITEHDVHGGDCAHVVELRRADVQKTLALLAERAAARNAGLDE